MINAVWILPSILALIPRPVHAGRTALLVIDMQPRFANLRAQLCDPENVAKLDRALARQRELIRTARREEMSICLVEYEGWGETFAVLLDEIGDHPRQMRVLKTYDGVFNAKGRAAHQLRSFLEAEGTRDLIVVGANGAGCVAASIEGAIRNQFRVWADPKATIDFEGEEFRWPFAHEDLVRNLRRLGDDHLLRTDGLTYILNEHARVVARRRAASSCADAVSRVGTADQKRVNSTGTD